MKAKLIRYRVQNFRSITDSNWIYTNDVGCLVGTNESGKTNILLALWKLNPANEEPIEPLIDYPRKKYHNYNKTNGNEIFISAEFEFPDDVAKELETEIGWHYFILKNIIVSRKFNGDYKFEFVNDSLKYLPSNELVSLINNAVNYLENSELKTKESPEVFTSLNSFLIKLAEKYNQDKDFTQKDFIECKNEIDSFLEKDYKRKVNINNFFQTKLLKPLSEIIEGFNAGGIQFTTKCQDILESYLPTFVYYSDYGNLDSEIYLPHVIDNFKRDDLGEKERAKVRSLKVLFEFVNLSPDQILELGKEAYPRRVITKDVHGRVQSDNIEDPTDQNIEEESEKKKEREILLQSASTSLTADFRQWWKQGNYKFRFQADGNHFRIWVSDEKRSEEIELEGRSRGLQWFFSFFLVFLVESKDAHSNCILLLDEPGLSLHPMAQFDLSAFFSSLSKENQLIYTTHSPFLVNPNRLGSVYAMYIGENGDSIVSPDLRANKKVAEKSIYPIHAAIGITVADTLLIGCQPILVEGVSDQIYLQLVKTYVLSQGKYINSKELVFIPTGGVKGMSPVIKIITGHENDLPYVILDADAPGQQKKELLIKNLYKNEVNKVLTIDDFIGKGDYEIEDLMPKDDLARIFAKQYRRTTSDDEFDYIYDSSKPIINQMEEYAKLNGYTLEDGWKVELAKDFQKSFERIISRTGDDIKENWIKLINKLTNI